MALGTAQLIFKKNLTEDVFELHYSLSEEKEFIAGQFITFILPGIGGRSYSILEMIGNTAVLVIKKWEISQGGRGGSISLCDAQIDESFKYVGPAGHFILTPKHVSRLFLGTGTGLVPLYSHILAGLKENTDAKKYQLVFGVRNIKDLYYIERFESLKLLYPDTFYYHLVVSRDASEGLIHQGYVTDFITSKSIESFEEYYICGAPAMIESCEKKLLDLGVSQEHIFFEKYA